MSFGVTTLERVGLVANGFFNGESKEGRLSQKEKKLENVGTPPRG